MNPIQILGRCPQSHIAARTLARSTMFIVGPARQCKLMVKPKRITSLLVFFGCMVLTILVASSGGIESVVPALVLAGLQFCAAVYYFMSFIVSMLAERTFLPHFVQPTVLPDSFCRVDCVLDHCCACVGAPLLPY
eukprot:COSAG02_NODE_8646_length_2494_cov_1.645929_1_plen_135_part_00